MKKKMKRAALDKYVSRAKSLIDMPYNMLNLDTYFHKFQQKTKSEIRLNYKLAPGPIKLMCGNHVNAGIVYHPLNKKKVKRNIYIVGKGILFDAGGLNIKAEMTDMKADMAGAAIALLVADYFRSELQQDRVHAVCPISTNFIDNNNISPGDYITIGNKIVEINDTDAEGRLILAEALTGLNIQKDDIVITVATLTGVVEDAVGEKATGIFSPNDKLIKYYLEAAKEHKELAWRLPLWSYLEKDLKKKKIKNWDKHSPGASTAALFVKQFLPVSSMNWIHLDIAFSSWDAKKEKATGQPVKSLISFIKKLL